MDLSMATDINELKAMAYDQIALKEQAERNLTAINNRIAELAARPQQPPVFAEPGQPEPVPANRKHK